MKLISKFYLFFFVLALFSNHLLAQNPRVVVGDVTGSPGEVVSVPVTIENLTEHFSGIQFYSTFLGADGPLNFEAPDFIAIDYLEGYLNPSNTDDFNFLGLTSNPCGNYYSNTFTVANINVQIPFNQTDCITIVPNLNPVGSFSFMIFHDTGINCDYSNAFVAGNGELDLVSGSICIEQSCTPTLYTNPEPEPCPGFTWVPVYASGFECDNWYNLFANIELDAPISQAEIIGTWNMNNTPITANHNSPSNFVTIQSPFAPNFSVNDDEVVFWLCVNIKQAGTYNFIDDGTPIFVFGNNNSFTPFETDYSWVSASSSSCRSSNKTSLSKEEFLAKGPYNETILDNAISIKNSPNPFSTYTNIEYTLTQDEKVSIHIYDITGKQIKQVLGESQQSSGTHQIHFDGTDLPDGVYLVSIRSGDRVETHRMVVAK